VQYHRQTNCEVSNQGILCLATEQRQDKIIEQNTSAQKLLTMSKSSKNTFCDLSSLPIQHAWKLSNSNDSTFRKRALQVFSLIALETLCIGQVNINNHQMCTELIENQSLASLLTVELVTRRSSPTISTFCPIS
jgi:hypothetical protein